MTTALTVFVSGTYSDLREERDAVLDVIRRLGLVHTSMEYFGARANPPIEVCLDEVRRSDVFVALVGLRYGNLVPDQTISFTEAEYSEAHNLGRPCLVYVRDEGTAILPSLIESDPEKLAALNRFRSALRERHHVYSYRDTRDLAVQVAIDLSRLLVALPSTGAQVQTVQGEAGAATQPNADEIVRALDLRTEARLAFERATNTFDWDARQVLISDALDKWPSLPLARSWLGLTIVDEIVDKFKTEHMYTSQLGTFFHPLGGLQTKPPPPHDAIKWLELAEEVGETRDGYTAAGLAQMWGVTREYERMIGAVGRALSLNRELRSYLASTDRLILLVHACRFFEQLEELGRVLGVALPATEDEVRRSVERVDPTRGHGAADWFVVERAGSGIEQDPSKVPAQLMLFRGADRDGEPTSRARYVYSPIPPQTEDIPSVDGEWWPMDKLLDELHRRFVFLRQFDADQG